MGHSYEFRFIVEKAAISEKLRIALVGRLSELNNLPLDQHVVLEAGRTPSLAGIIKNSSKKLFIGGATLNIDGLSSFELSVEFIGNENPDFKAIPSDKLVFCMSIPDYEYYSEDARKGERFLDEAKLAYSMLHPRYGAGNDELTLEDEGFQPEERLDDYVNDEMFFCPEMVKSIGKDKLKNTPAAKVEVLEDGGMHISVLPDEGNPEKNYRVVAKYLGLKYKYYDEKINKGIVEDYRNK